MEWATFLPRDGSGAIIALLIGLVLGGPAILSSATLREKFSGLLFLPRARARWQREALEEDAARESAAIDALRARITAMQKDNEEERSWQQGKIKALRAELDEMERTNEERAARVQAELSQALEYITWVTDWGRRIVLWAHDKGYELPPPPWMTYQEWQKGKPPV